MPKRNRVTPAGEIVAVAERGTLMGNRGVLHAAAGDIRRTWQLKRWIACVLTFKGRRRSVMAPGRYTELFFLDEATALAAGHRPCAECRRDRFARRWLEEAGRDVPWLSTELPPAQQRSVWLIHTYDGSQWDPIATLLGERGPKRLLVISPFFDREAELARRVRQRWPKCQVEIVVQQTTTNLPVVPLRKLGTGISLSELRNSSRRLHAKLLSWVTDEGTGCLVGSANFTLAAFDARTGPAGVRRDGRRPNQTRHPATCFLRPVLRDATLGQCLNQHGVASGRIYPI